MTTTILHNPSCSASRKTLTLLREKGVEPKIVEYLKTPPTKAELKDLLKRAGLTPRDVLRKKGTQCEELRLDNPKLTDEQIIDAMLAHPVLIERPVVATAKGVRLCRPIDKVLEIL
jgi:arsenate reductase